MSDLSEYSTDQLAAEIERRKGKQKAVRIEELKQQADLLYQHIDAMLAISPKHSRTSCNDERVINMDRGCMRCYLICTKHAGFWSYEDVLNMHISETTI